MGSKKHKKHSRTRDDDDLSNEPSPQLVTMSGATQKSSGIKLVLKVGGGASGGAVSSSGASVAGSGGISGIPHLSGSGNSPAAGAAAAAGSSSNSLSSPVVAYSSTVPAPTPLCAGGYPATPGISLRLVTNADGAECTVRKVENPLVNGVLPAGGCSNSGINSSSSVGGAHSGPKSGGHHLPATTGSSTMHSEGVSEATKSSLHRHQQQQQRHQQRHQQHHHSQEQPQQQTPSELLLQQQHRHKKSEKKKKKKKKHHRHHSHCHHHKEYKEHHHKHQHSGEKRKERSDGDAAGAATSYGGGGSGGFSSAIGGGGSSSAAARVALADDDDDDLDAPPPAKRPLTETIDNQPPLPVVPLRSPVGVTPPIDQREVSPLQRLLGVLLELVRKRDTYEFFAWPVNDAIAPGYSTIIQMPMDLSTMKRRLDNREYRSLDAFRADVRLICDNAMTYNQPHTIYYKEARKLWRHAQKILNKDNVLQLDPELKYIGALSVDELGFDLRTKTPEPIEELAPRMTRNRLHHNVSHVGRTASAIDDPMDRGVERHDDRPVPPMKISLAATVVEQALASVGPPGSPVASPASSRDEKESILMTVVGGERVASTGTAASVTASAAAAAVANDRSPIIERTCSQDARAADARQRDDLQLPSPAVFAGRRTPVRPVSTDSAKLVNGDIGPQGGRTPVRPASPPGLAKKSRPDEELLQQERQQEEQRSKTPTAPPSDDASAAEILAHAQRMARGAANRLATLKPNTDYAFLRHSDDGSATLNILNPDVTLTDKYVGLRPPEPVPPQKVDLEMLIGKLPYGMSSLVDFKDEARSVAKPINYLPNESGPPFSTFAPHYDSSFSNLTKIESDLVYQTYGDELGVQYADSIMHFAKDCDYVINMVDNLLDTLTGGQHSKTLKLVRSGELLRDPEESAEETVERQHSRDGTDSNHAASKASSLFSSGGSSSSNSNSITMNSCSNSGGGQNDTDNNNKSVATDAQAKAAAANEKTTISSDSEKFMQAKDACASNGPTNQFNAATTAISNGPSAVKCNGTLTGHGTNALPAVGVSGLGKAPNISAGSAVVVANGHSPHAPPTIAASEGLHNGVLPGSAPQVQLMTHSGQIQPSLHPQQQRVQHLQQQQSQQQLQQQQQQHYQAQHQPMEAMGSNQVMASPGSSAVSVNHFVSAVPSTGKPFASGSTVATTALRPHHSSPAAAPPPTVAQQQPVVMVSGGGMLLSGSIHQGGLPTQPQPISSAPAGLSSNVGLPPAATAVVGAAAGTSNTTPAVPVSGGSTATAAIGAAPACANVGGAAPAPTSGSDKEQKLQAKLAESTEMIERLTRLQKERLSQPPPPHLGATQGPSHAEFQLAEKLAATLSELASHAKPGSIVSVDAIRRAMGITLLPPTSSASSQPQTSKAQPPPATQSKSTPLPHMATGYPQTTSSSPAPTSDGSAAHSGTNSTNSARCNINNSNNNNNGSNSMASGSSHENNNAAGEGKRF